MVQRRSFLAGLVAGAGAGALIGRSAWKVPAEPPPPPARPGPQAPPEGRVSYSQQGEDIALYHLLHDLLRVSTPTYLDIGAADPVKGSNTYLLYCTGGRGVLVEPNPAYVEKLRLRRPEDVVVAAGIGVGSAREADYYVIRGRPPLNTFSPEAVEAYRAEFGADPVERIVRMPLLPVNEVIANHLGRAPDLLSIDIEGLDLPVLRTLDFARFRPGVIIAETIRRGSPGVNMELLKFLAAKRYFVRGGSAVNTIFVDLKRYG